MRLAMYVDGWNFYWSLVGANLKPYGWCDFPLLTRQQTSAPADAEVTVKYFTSPDKPHPEKIADRQRPIWWRALDFIGCQVIEGEFRETSEEVEEQNRYSGKRWREKQTYIKLATHMMADASLITKDPLCPGSFRWSPGYDKAVLLTQDTDFIPLVRAVSAEPFSRSVMVLLPPSAEPAQSNACRIWNEHASRNVVVKQLQKSDLASALLPYVVTGCNGQSVKCHPTWMWREKHEASNPRRAASAAAPKSTTTVPGSLTRNPGGNRKKGS